MSLVGMILPLVAFPARFGLDLARPSVVNMLYEMAFYGLVVFSFCRRASLMQLLTGAGVCLVYRLVVGAVFGLLIAAMYTMELGLSLSLGLSGYLPAILFHVAMAPFVLRPIIERLVPNVQTEHLTASVRSDPARSAETGLSSVAVSKERGIVAELAPLPQSPRPLGTNAKSIPNPEPLTSPTDRDMSGFEKAVCYIGEHASVHLAAVVDEEGLLLGNFTRNQIDPEFWAPLALLFLQGGGDILKRAELYGLERLELQLQQKRVVVARSVGCNLMVVSERLDDDLLNIRINQGLDMINRFVTERYGDKLNSNAEKIHVSSAQ